MAADGIDEHHLAQAFEERVAAGTSARGFRRREAHELLAPAAAAVPGQMQESRQGSDQGIEGPHVAADETAHQSGRGAITGRR